MPRPKKPFTVTSDRISTGRRTGWERTRKALKQTTSMSGYAFARKPDLAIIGTMRKGELRNVYVTRPKAEPEMPRFPWVNRVNGEGWKYPGKPCGLAGSSRLCRHIALWPIAKPASHTT